MSAPKLESFNVTLAAQCLELCHTLTSKCIPFNFSIKAGTFYFSMDTKGEMKEPPTMKKKTPHKRGGTKGEQMSS